MSSGTLTTPNGSNSGLAERHDDGSLTTRPQVGAVAVAARVEAEAKAALAIAKAQPRDEVDALDRIKNACQRQGLAERAEYVYSRGGTNITGPTIKLLEVVAGAWGNIQSGFRVLSSTKLESVVEAFAWDLETNNKKVMEFVVPHIRSKRSGNESLSDPRDIYELIASTAQRRVRKCLEGVVPTDVVEDALNECKKTLKTKLGDITADRIKKMVDTFADFGVSKEQIEERIQRRIDSIAPAQFVDLGRIANSLKDGMSTVDDWFKPAAKDSDSKPEEPQSAKDKLKAAKKQKTLEDELREDAARHERGDAAE